MKQKYKIDTIRHSFAHLMALAIKEIFGEVEFGIGPVIENGFYYDVKIAKSEKTNHRITQITDADLIKIESEMRELAKRHLKFKRKKINLDEALQLFQKLNQPFKIELIEDIKKYGTTKYDEISSKSEAKKEKSLEKISIYQLGDFIDLCRGPHVNSTKDLPMDAFKIIKIAGAYWRGNPSKPMLQRIYGAAFISKKELDAYLKLQKELENRDHRKLGERLDLFSFHSIAPNAPFWHPKGMIIFKELENYWRNIHEKNGYQEISTPIMVKKEVFEKSGHLKYYKENMFPLIIENETYYLKPMNCPESTYVYNSKIRSYKDLPIRLSEIGRLHRNELSGVMLGMFRVRQITMDDAHIYCRPDQIQKEIFNILKLIKSFYKLFNLKPIFNLATRPDDFMGEIKLWKKAERALKYALEINKLKYNLKPKDGAFYGPKIDIHIKDVLNRDWQLATIQLDFQLAKNFELYYINEKGQKETPIVIHRAIFGSFERFIGILIEHFGGNLPLWLSPIQCVIIPIGTKHKKSAENLFKNLLQENIRVELWNQNETVGKKIREAEILKIPYILVIGDKEMKKNAIRIRSLNKDFGMMTIKKFIDKIKKEIENKKLLH